MTIEKVLFVSPSPRCLRSYGKLHTATRLSGEQEFPEIPTDSAYRLIEPIHAARNPAEYWREHRQRSTRYRPIAVIHRADANVCFAGRIAALVIDGIFSLRVLYAPGEKVAVTALRRVPIEERSDTIDDAFSGKRGQGPIEQVIADVYPEFMAAQQGPLRTIGAAKAFLNAQIEALADDLHLDCVDELDRRTERPLGNFRFQPGADIVIGRVGCAAIAV